MSIKGKGRRIDNVNESRSGSVGLRPEIDLSDVFITGQPDYCQVAVPLLVKDEIWILYVAKGGSAQADQYLQVVKSFDGGKTWDSGTEVHQLSSTDGVSHLSAFYDAIRNRIIVLYDNGEVLTGGNFNPETLDFTDSTVAQPWDTNISFKGNISRVDRYLYSVVSGYDSGDDTDHPAIIESQDGGENWTVKQKLSSFDGIAFSIFSVITGESEVGNDNNLRIILGNASQPENASVLHSEASFSDFKQHFLPFGLASAKTTDTGDEILLIGDNRHISLNFQVIFSSSKNGLDWKVPARINGYRSVVPNLCVLPNGEVLTAFVNDNDLGGSRRDLYSTIIDPPKLQNYPEKNLLYRFTNIASGASIDSRKLQNEKFKCLRISAQTAFSLSNLKITKKTSINKFKSTISEEVATGNQLARIHHIPIDTSGLFYLSIENVNENASLAIEVSLVDKNESQRCSALSILNGIQGNNRLSRIRNLTQEIGLRDLHPSSTQYLGWGGLCSGRNDELILFYSENSEHSPTAGTKVFGVRSTDDGKTWEKPVVLFDTENIESHPVNPHLSYDSYGDRYFLTTAVRRDDGTTYSRILNGDPGEDVVTRGAVVWNTGTITGSYTEKQAVSYGIQRVGADRLVATVFGKDTGDAFDFMPGLVESSDGENWTVTKFKDVPANEACFYLRYNRDKNASQYLLCRANDGNSAYLIKTDDGFITYNESRRMFFSVAGGHNIYDNDGVLILISRQNHSSFDSMAFISYSIDGEAWTHPQPLDIPYPVQPHFTKHKGHLLIAGCAQFSRNNNDGSVWMAEINPPTYQEVLQRLQNSIIEAFPRYTTVGAAGEFVTEFMPYKKIAVMIKANSSVIPETLKIQLQSSWDYTAEDTFTVDITNKFVRSDDDIFLTAIIEPEGKWWRIRLDNTGGAEFEIKGQVTIKDY